MRLVEDQNARDAVEVGVGGLPVTVLLRNCYLPADRMIALRAAASALSFTVEKPRATGTLQRALSRVVSGKGTQDQPTPGSDVSGGVHPICQTGELLSLDTGRMPLAFHFLPPPSPPRGTGFPPVCSGTYQTAPIPSDGLLSMSILTASLTELLYLLKGDKLTTLKKIPKGKERQTQI